MEKMSCNVVRDLLPLYDEGLTSEETNTVVRSHLDECKDCTEYYVCCNTDLDLRIDKPTKSDRKIIRWMRLKFLWYLFWPLFYGVSWQFGWQNQTLRFMIEALIVVFTLPFYSSFEINFDPEKRKEYYSREEKNINSGKSSLLSQAVFMSLPILIPVLFGVIPLIIKELIKP